MIWFKLYSSSSYLPLHILINQVYFTHSYQFSYFIVYRTCYFLCCYVVNTYLRIYFGWHNHFLNKSNEFDFPLSRVNISKHNQVYQRYRKYKLSVWIKTKSVSNHLGTCKLNLMVNMNVKKGMVSTLLIDFALELQIIWWFVDVNLKFGISQNLRKIIRQISHEN